MLRYNDSVTEMHVRSCFRPSCLTMLYTLLISWISESHRKNQQDATVFSSSSIGATTLGGFCPALWFRSTIFYLYISLSSFSLSSSLNPLLLGQAISLLVFLLVLMSMVGDRVVEFIIPVFLNCSTCFGRHTAHHQELKNCNCSLWFYIRLWLQVAAAMAQPSQRQPATINVCKTRGCNYSFWAPDDGRCVARNMLSN